MNWVLAKWWPEPLPNEKIIWGKLNVDTPSYVIESDATIVAPLIFAYLLDW